MNANDIYDGITDIRDDLVDGAKDSHRKRKRNRRARWPGAVAAALAVVLIAGVFSRPGRVLTKYAIAQAEYPEMAPYPKNPSNDRQYEAWWKDIEEQRRDLGDISSLQVFFARSAQTFLTDAQGENRVYSPVNVYMALSMLARLTDGNSREQILTLLGSETIEDLQKQAGDIWNCSYRDDKALTSILAASLWLDRDIRFNQDTMDDLARNFYASSYQGEMGSDKFNKALQEWLNKQTGGLLKDQAEEIKMDPDTILALAATVCFRAKWSNEFHEEDTSPQIFHTPDGDIETEFMYQRTGDTYFWGDSFSAISQNFEHGGSMYFLLPDEGITPEELLSDREAMDFLFSNTEWKNQKYLTVNKLIPKFDAASRIDLSKGLQSLGVTDIFDPEASDFSPMTTDNVDPVIVSRADHAARVVIDEEGCVATAFTVMAASGSGSPPGEEVDFTLDRPFLFCVTGDSGLPLFVGVVNTPGAGER